MNSTTRRSCSSTLSLRSILAAGCLSLASLAGCAPEGVTADPAVEPATVASLPTQLTLSPVPVIFVPGTQGTQATPTLSVTTPTVDRANRDLRVRLREFDVAAFGEAIDRAGKDYVPGVAALPGQPAATAGETLRAVRNVVGRSVHDAEVKLEHEQPACGGDEVSCAERFVDAVTRIDGQLAHEIADLARSLGPVSADLQVSLWRSERDGVETPVAVTLQGHRDGRLVGIIVFQ